MKKTTNPGSGRRLRTAAARMLVSVGLLLSGLAWMSSAQADTQTRTSSFDYDARGLLVR